MSFDPKGCPTGSGRERASAGGHAISSAAEPREVRRRDDHVPQPSLPFVSVVMPVRNEASFLDRSLGAVLSQSYPAERYEVVVVDGSSEDGTAAKARSWAGSTDVAVTVVDNPARITPVSLNLALSRARGEVIVRVDGHCVVEPDFIEASVRVLHDSAAACVGGPIRTVGAGRWAAAIAAAQSSTFGVGGVAVRTSTAAQDVDTVAFGAYRREVFDRIGAFDEDLVRNQDDEFNFRLLQAGGRIRMDPSIRSTYFSRTDVRGLARQYHGYGTYKVLVWRKRRAVASARQLVPGVFVSALASASIMSAVLRRGWPLASIIVPYGTANLAASARTGRGAGVAVWRVALANTTMHIAYGIGLLNGVRRFGRGAPAERRGSRLSSMPERGAASSPSGRELLENLRNALFVGQPARP